MTKEDKIKLAEECGLSYAGPNDEGEPEFIGNDKAWNKFTQEQELINESGRLVEADKIFGEE